MRSFHSMALAWRNKIVVPDWFGGKTFEQHLVKNVGNGASCVLFNLGLLAIQVIGAFLHDLHVNICMKCLFTIR